MEYETSQHIGTRWDKCDFEWGLEGFVIIKTEQGQRLILMDVFQWRKGNSGGVKAVPVMLEDLHKYEANND